MKKFFEKFTGFVKNWKIEKFFRGFIKGAKNDKHQEEAALELKKTAELSNDLINKVRLWLQSPLGDIITFVIPGDADNKFKEKAVAVLTKFTHQTALLMGCFESKKTVGEQLLCVYSKVVGLGEEDKVKSFWHEMAIVVVKALADGQLTFSEAIYAAQVVYDMLTKKKLNV